jgi:hypothetical protein
MERLRLLRTGRADTTGATVEALRIVRAGSRCAAVDRL